MRSNKKIIIACGITIAILALVFLSQIVKNRGGLNVKCEVDYPVSENMVHYRQDDDRWKTIHLGESKYTMESSGCITTCIASAISESSGALSPGGVATLLSENNINIKNITKLLTQFRIFLALMRKFTVTWIQNI